MAGPLVERFRARCNSHPEPVCSPSFQTLVLPAAPAAQLPVSSLFPISEHNRGDCYQRAVDISAAANVGALAGHGQYEGLRGFSITLPVGQHPSFDMVAIGNGNIGYGGNSSNQPLYFGNPGTQVTRQTTASGAVVEWIHRGGDMPMAISREVNGDQCTYRVWFMDQANSSQRGGIVSLAQADGSTRYHMVALDRIPPVAPVPVAPAPAPVTVAPAPPVAPAVPPVAAPLLSVPPPRAVPRRPSSDDPVPMQEPAPAVPPSDRPLTPPVASLSSNPFTQRGFVDEAGSAFELTRVTGDAAQRLAALMRRGSGSNGGVDHVALDDRHMVVALPRTEGGVPDHILVENRGTAEAPEIFAAAVRHQAGQYRRLGEEWRQYFGEVSRTVARAAHGALGSSL